jgi:hypothetical protein
MVEPDPDPVVVSPDLTALEQRLATLEQSFATLHADYAVLASQQVAQGQAIDASRVDWVRFMERVKMLAG